MVSHSIHDWRFHEKPTQGVTFKIYQDQLMGFTEAQEPGPGKIKKYRKDKVSKYGQKSVRNAVPDHK